MTDIELSVNGVSSIDLSVLNGDTVDISVIEAEPIVLSVVSRIDFTGTPVQVFYGTDDPPNPEGYADGSFYFKLS